MTIALKVLLVEDRPDDGELLIHELRGAGYNPEFIRVTTEADYLKHLQPDLDIILADYSLPQFDGLRALDLLNECGYDIPLILVSGSIGEELATSAMRQGAADYLLKDRLARFGPAVANALQQRRLRRDKLEADQAVRESEARLSSILASTLDAIITLDEKQQVVFFNPAAESMFRCAASDVLGYHIDRFIPEAFREIHRQHIADYAASGVKSRMMGTRQPLTGLRDNGEEFPLEASISQVEVGDQKLFTVFIRDVTERVHAQGALQQAHAELETAYEQTLEGWSKALNLRDQETEVHTIRVAEVSALLAESLGVPPDQLSHIRRGALLHDIGKVGIPDSILLKPGPLNEYEWAIMRLHPVYAYQMLSPISYLRQALDIPYYHHEKWDGTGYPRKLKGEAIPLAARIFAVVDVWDALSFSRPYRPAWPPERVMDHIRSLAGTHFDPQVVIAFLKLTSRLPTGEVHD
jgi:PAS domain S-box-containing protein/putative nucleotidyltransferase with HDIG domain